MFFWTVKINVLAAYTLYYITTAEQRRHKIVSHRYVKEIHHLRSCRLPWQAALTVGGVDCSLLS